MPSELAAGTVLAGRYRIERELGKGREELQALQSR